VVPVLVELKDELVIPEPVEHAPVVRPIRALERDQVAGVDLADRGDQFLVEAHERLGVLRAVIAGNGLVEEVVQRDRRIVAVAARQLDPEGDRQLLVAPVGEEVGQPRESSMFAPVCPPGAPCRSRMT